MERVKGLLAVILGFYDSIDTRTDAYIDSLGGAYDKIKTLASTSLHRLVN
jgi:hypothetical protein